MMKTKRSILSDGSGVHSIPLQLPRLGRDLTYPATGRGIGKRTLTGTENTEEKNSNEDKEEEEEEEESKEYETVDKKYHVEERPYSKNLQAGKQFRTRTCSCDKLQARCQHNHPFQFQSVYAAVIPGYESTSRQEHRHLPPPGKKLPMVVNTEEVKSTKVKTFNCKKRLRDDEPSSFHPTPEKRLRENFKVDPEQQDIKYIPDGYQMWEENDPLSLTDFELPESFEQVHRIGDEEFHHIDWNFVVEILNNIPYTDNMTELSLN